DRLAERLPTLRFLTRKPRDIEAQAQRLLPAFVKALLGHALVSVTACESQVGSGSLPSGRLPSFALRLEPTKGGVKRVAGAFRALPVPVIGRVHDGAFCLDLRCLENDGALTAQLTQISLA